eukprot:TRINITY_DN35733_c0_g1_i1.p1 TRINITY_DN35733_c0_g1~~TRINITY_DN35733_c0_g1_i1.p1  ORF type:complete len:178 (-),score=39.97 TRINITY_DN35733_c0_g1_i1:41-574(-)
MVSTEQKKNGFLAPQLHELRAKDVLVVARAFSPCRLPDFLWPASSEASVWRELALEHCFESLRRHENFLDSSWNTLLPFKLLCLEVELGTFGTRQLREVLSPMLYSFVERLRSLSKEECEANRLRREGVEEGAEEELEAATSAEGAVKLEGTHCNVLTNSKVQDLPVDIILEALSAA